MENKLFNKLLSKFFFNNIFKLIKINHTYERILKEY